MNWIEKHIGRLLDHICDHPGRVIVMWFLLLTVLILMTGCSGTREQAERIQQLQDETALLRQGLDAASGMASWLGQMGIVASICAAAAPVCVGVGLSLFLFGRPKLATTAWTAAAGCAVVPFAAYAMMWAGDQMAWTVPVAAGLLVLLACVATWQRRHAIERRLGVDLDWDGNVGEPAPQDLPALEPRHD